MPGYLIDTNVLSEIRRGAGRAQAEVWQWWIGMREEDLFVSVMTLGEIRKGIDRLGKRDPNQALVLEHWLAAVKESHSDRVLDVGAPVAERWGKLQAIRPLPEIDALLAASALERDLTLVTRNVADFQGVAVRVFNPFDSV